MRLEILNSGYGLGTKVMFALIHLASRQPLPDAAKLVFYRPDFYGTPMKEFTHLAMRGPSAWSVGDRELMAAFVSKTNENAFCIRNRVFAMHVGEDLVLKLPPKRVAELIESGVAGPNAVGGRPMKEWANIRPDREEDWSDLARESLEYVGKKA